MRLMNALATLLVAVSVRGSTALLNLSLPYVQSSTFPTPDGQKLIKIAEAEDDIHAFIALECGKVVAEYGDQESIRHLFSMTKSWTGLLMGIAETEGKLSLNETLWDIWPNETIWIDVEDAEDRKKTTLEQLVQMRGGYDMPEDFLKDVAIDILPFNDNRLGGSDFKDSLTYHPLNTTNIGKYNYVMAGNLLGHIIKERVGKVPIEYAKEKVFPFLGIADDDYEWYHNYEDVQTSSHGLKMNTVALSKLGMLYLQGGMANNDEQIVDPSWIKRSFTVGDENAKDKFGYIGWWLGTEPAYATYGFGGQRLAVNLETHRVVAILSDTYYKDAGIDAYENPKAPYPTDEIKNFVFEMPSNAQHSLRSGEPLICETNATTTTVNPIPVTPPTETNTTTVNPEPVSPPTESSSGNSLQYSAALLALAIPLLIFV